MNFPNECPQCGRPTHGNKLCIRCIENSWNNQADRYNQWSVLNQDEKDSWITKINTASIKERV